MKISENTNESLLEQNIKRLKNGAVLLSREILQDPNFEATIVLICIHNIRGSYGLVLNRVAHIPITELFDGYNGMNISCKVHIGGPIQHEDLQVLQITSNPIEGSVSITPRVYMTGTGNIAGDFLPLSIINEPSYFLFSGYAGWSPGQIEDEIRAGAWDVYTVDVEKLLNNVESSFGADIDELDRFLKSFRPQFND